MAWYYNQLYRKSSADGVLEGVSQKKKLTKNAGRLISHRVSPGIQPFQVGRSPYLSPRLLSSANRVLTLTSSHFFTRQHFSLEGYSRNVVAITLARSA